MADLVLHCSICGKPVRLEEAKTDSKGHAVHESCFASDLAHTLREQKTPPVENTNR
jgi:hypothetical protein